MRIALTVAFTALMLSPSLAEPTAVTENAAARSEDPVICRPSADKWRRGTHQRARPICYTASQWKMKQYVRGSQAIDPPFYTGDGQQGR